MRKKTDSSTATSIPGGGDVLEGAQRRVEVVGGVVGGGQHGQEAVGGARHLVVQERRAAGRQRARDPHQLVLRADVSVHPAEYQTHAPAEHCTMLHVNN